MFRGKLQTPSSEKKYYMTYRFSKKMKRCSKTQVIKELFLLEPTMLVLPGVLSVTMASNRVPESLSCNFYFKHVVNDVFQIGSYSKSDIPSPENY